MNQRQPQPLLWQVEEVGAVVVVVQELAPNAAAVMDTPTPEAASALRNTRIVHLERTN